tara:strand:- start:210 stop:515 length:306 start_codon:yes stop_codon:yes gene_type:complete
MAINVSKGVAKGFCRINGAGVLHPNHLNVASVTDSATGDRTIVWDTDFGNTDYVIVGSDTGGNQGSTFNYASFATGSVRLRCRDISNNLQDFGNSNIAHGE